MDAAKNFLDATEERADLNQYWFSPGTVSTFVAEICEKGGRSALVSSPSVYFSLPEELRKICKVLDFDRQWQSDPGYVFYDFNEPEELPKELCGSFDFVLIDPPFITREVWEKYALTARFLAAEGACLLCTTIAENAAMMSELLGLHPAKFRPGIPNLVYQYSIYVNYRSDRLGKLNPEIDQDDWQIVKPTPAVTMADERPVGGAQELPEMEEMPNFEETAELLLLSELRRQLFGLKRAVEAIQAPLQLALRRNSQGSGGTAAAAAAAKVEAARGAAVETTKSLEEWLEGHAVEVSVAMEVDPWHVPELHELRSLLESYELNSDWSSLCRNAAAKLFQRSNQVLERTKVLKAQQKLRLRMWHGGAYGKIEHMTSASVRHHLWPQIFLAHESTARSDTGGLLFQDTSSKFSPGPVFEIFQLEQLNNGPHWGGFRVHGSNFQRVARLDVVNRVRRLNDVGLLKERPKWLTWCERVPPIENHNLQLQTRTVRSPYPQMVNFLLKKHPDLRFQDCYVDGNDWSAGNDAYRDDHPVMQFVGKQLEIMRTQGVSKKEAFEQTEEHFRDRRRALETEQKLMMAMAVKAGFQPMFCTGRAYLEVEKARLESAHMKRIIGVLRRERQKAMGQAEVPKSTYKVKESKAWAEEKAEAKEEAEELQKLAQPQLPPDVGQEADPAVMTPTSTPQDQKKASPDEEEKATYQDPPLDPETSYTVISLRPKGGALPDTDRAGKVEKMIGRDKKREDTTADQDEGSDEDGGDRQRKREEGDDDDF